MPGKKPAVHEGTPDFNFFSNTLAVDRDVYIKVAIADYKGEQPAMVVGDLPERFAGPRDNRLINALFFLVDFVPRVVEEEKVLDDEKTLQWLQSDTMNKIQKRIADHHKYVQTFTLQMVFTAVYSKNLRSVRLLINKMDLLEQVVLRGWIHGVTYESIEPFARSAFADTEKEIKAACEANGITDFSVHLVSANKESGVRFMAAEVWRTHLRANGVTVI